MCSVSYHKGNEEALVPPASSDPQLGTSLGEEPGHSPLGLIALQGVLRDPQRRWPSCQSDRNPQECVTALCSQRSSYAGQPTPLDLSTNGGLPQLPASHSSWSQYGAKTGPGVEMGCPCSPNQHLMSTCFVPVALLGENETRRSLDSVWSSSAYKAIPLSPSNTVTFRLLATMCVYWGHNFPSVLQCI